MNVRSEKSSDSKGAAKSNRFDELREKPKIKPKPRPRPPPVSFADILKLAEQKQAQPVMVGIAPKKEKERRPMTQEEIDRKLAREERMKTKDYQDWYKFGTTANAKQDKSEKAGSPPGGFLRTDHNVIPLEDSASHSKPFSIPRKGGNTSSAKTDTHSGSTKTDTHSGSTKSDSKAHTSTSNRPSTSKSSHSRPVHVPKPHPTRPGMTANKPQAVAQHVNGDRKSEAVQPSAENKQKPSSSSASSSQNSSAQHRPKASGGAVADKTREGNAWDKLFNRPEYKKMKEAPAPKRKMVIDSESEEDEYDDEMDDFIDDGEVEDAGAVSKMIQQMFGYDRRKFRDEDDDDRNMEVGFSQVMKEEARSARIGLKEDLEDIRKEQEEMRLKALKRKRRT
ncbi:uncharacterized protein LOC143275059 [Babylonia areolata]|uniref:uncharacterized protein LOC143275059 n=1 Tax=Babylonia areolata TaxID=304850 RepID=UPI003FD0A5F5